MPKIKSYTAPWLAQGPGQGLFAPAAETPSAYASKTKKKDVPGPRRVIARRGTEVFVAVGRELRWGDLAYLKEKHSTKQPAWRSSRIKREGSVTPGAPDDTLQSIDDVTTAQGFRVRSMESGFARQTPNKIWVEGRLVRIVSH